MGAFAKSGSRPIEEGIKVAERLRRVGLWLRDSVPDRRLRAAGAEDG